jgi:twinkle protein
LVFQCETHTKGDGETTHVRRTTIAGDVILTGIEYKELHSRKLREETCQKFGYGVVDDFGGTSAQVAPYYDADGNLVAQKVRKPGKEFTVLGSLKNALPFGAHAWDRTGRSIVVTEGEIDALSMSQVQGNKWPVVSIPNGAAGARAHMSKQRDYYLGFEKVVIMFDSDEPGLKAAKEAAAVIGRRAHIAYLPQDCKDPNEMLKAGRAEELISAMWRAEPYRPEGIVEMSTLGDQVLMAPEYGLSWFLPALTDLTYGIRTGEIYAFGAGTGIGKTDFFTQQVMHFVTEHKVPVGYFALEQAPRETAIRLTGKFAGKTFHIPDSGWTHADKEAAWSQLTKTGKVFLYDSFGANEWDVVREKIEYLAHAEGVKYIFLDHLTAFAAAEEDERKALESIMAEMGGLVKKLDIAIFLISHLATPEGKPHEEGGRVMIRHFKGSRAIGFWCHYMFGLERDQQAESDAFRTTTTLRCSRTATPDVPLAKCAISATTTDTGLLYETTDPAKRDAKMYGFEDEEEGDVSPTGTNTEKDF